MVHDSTAPAFGPGMRTFHNPALGQYYEPWIRVLCLGAGQFGVVQRADRTIARVPHDFDTNMVLLLDVAGAFAAVRSIGVELLKSRRLGACLGDDRSSGIVVLHTRSGHGKHNDQAHRVDDEIAFATLDLLACIEPTFSTLR